MEHVWAMPPVSPSSSSTWRSILFGPHPKMRGWLGRPPRAADEKIRAQRGPGICPRLPSLGGSQLWTPEVCSGLQLWVLPHPTPKETKLHLLLPPLGLQLVKVPPGACARNPRLSPFPLLPRLLSPLLSCLPPQPSCCTLGRVCACVRPWRALSPVLVRVSVPLPTAQVHVGVPRTETHSDSQSRCPPLGC